VNSWSVERRPRLVRQVRLEGERGGLDNVGEHEAAVRRLGDVVDELRAGYVSTSPFAVGRRGARARPSSQPAQPVMTTTATVFCGWALWFEFEKTSLPPTSLSCVDYGRGVAGIVIWHGRILAGGARVRCPRLAPNVASVRPAPECPGPLDLPLHAFTPHAAYCDCR
jgi:hypothetical protein